MRISNIPLRAAAGAHLLNAAGRAVREPESAGQLYDTLTARFPAMKHQDPEVFRLAVAVVEGTMGGLLLLPFVRSRLTGLALAALSGAVIGVRAGNRNLSGSNGLPLHGPELSRLAEDAWMLGAGLALALQRRRT